MLSVSRRRWSRWGAAGARLPVALTSTGNQAAADTELVSGDTAAGLGGHLGFPVEENISIGGGWQHQRLWRDEGGAASSPLSSLCCPHLSPAPLAEGC